MELDPILVQQHTDPLSDLVGVPDLCGVSDQLLPLRVDSRQDGLRRHDDFLGYHGRHLRKPYCLKHKCLPQRRQA